MQGQQADVEQKTAGNPGEWRNGNLFQGGAVLKNDAELFALVFDEESGRPFELMMQRFLLLGNSMIGMRRGCDELQGEFFVKFFSFNEFWKIFNRFKIRGFYSAAIVQETVQIPEQLAADAGFTKIEIAFFEPNPFEKDFFQHLRRLLVPELMDTPIIRNDTLPSLQNRLCISLALRHVPVEQAGVHHNIEQNELGALGFSEFFG